MHMVEFVCRGKVKAEQGLGVGHFWLMVMSLESITLLQNMVAKRSMVQFPHKIDLPH